MASKNLWGDLGKLENIRTPKTVLAEQASYLSDATGGLLIGKVRNEVETSPLGLTSPVFHSYLAIVALPLDGYTYEVLSISHGIEMYPVEITDHVNTRVLNATDEEELLQCVQRILSSSDVHKVIMLLISQMKG